MEEINAFIQNTYKKIKGNNSHKKVIIDVLLLFFIAIPFIVLIFYGNVGTASNSTGNQNLTNSWQSVSPALSNTSTVPSVTLSPNDTIPAYSPSSWLTYTNSFYNYSVKYPPGWKIATNGGGAFLIIESPDFIQNSLNPQFEGAFIMSVVPTKETTIESYYKREDNTGPMANKKLSIDGTNAIQFDSVINNTVLPIRNTQFIMKGYVYNFNAGSYTNQQTEEKYLSIYNQVLATFTYIQ